MPKGTTRRQQLHPLETRFVKEFSGHGFFDGVVQSYDAKTEFYHVVYPKDGDAEDMDEEELTWLLNAQKEADDDDDIGKEKEDDNKALENSTRKKRRVATTPLVAAATLTTTSRYGRSRKQLHSYNEEDYFNDSDFAESEEDADNVPPIKRTRTSKNESRGKMTSKKTSTSKGGRIQGSLKQSGSDSESDVWMADVDDEDDMAEDGKNKQGGRGRSAKNKAAGASADVSTAKKGGKKKMAEAFQPINAPSFSDLSLKKIHETKEYLDPCGMEATDNIIDRLVGEQVTKIGSLLQRALLGQQTWKQQPEQKKDFYGAKSTSTALGSKHNPLKLGTACSGTDAPALALTLIQEQLEQSHLFVSDVDKDVEGNNSTRNTKTNEKAVEPTKSTSLKLHYSHKYSCENDPFKQAYLARNFDSFCILTLVNCAMRNHGMFMDKSNYCPTLIYLSLVHLVKTLVCCVRIDELISKTRVVLVKPSLQRLKLS